MPSLFDGKWRLDSAENVAAYYDAIKSPEAYKNTLLQVLEGIKQNPDIYIEELTVDDTKVQRRSVIGGQTNREVKDAPLNVEIDDKMDDGRPAQIKLVREGDNKVVRTQKFDGLTTTSTFEVNGDTLTLVQTIGSVSTTQIYKKLA